MSVWCTSPIISETQTTTNQVKRSRSDDVVDDGVRQPMTLDYLLTVMTEQFKLTQERIEAVSTTISEKIDSVKAELDDKLSSVSREIASFKEECGAKFLANEGALNALDERVNGITLEIGGIEKRNELVISGIPYLPGENLANYFQTMWKHVGLNEAHTPTVDIRRLNSSTSVERQDGLILVEFVLRNQRDDFYSSYLRKCNLQLSHLGINSTRRFYVNESLTVAARKIKAAALRLKKAGRLSTVYTKQGIVFLKGLGDQHAVAVYSESQLEQVK
uniref:(northern house mosquito) hypothetical protein n=1 Tax=Culex pipiens TaxID=7175 RepID=A0A8D8A7B2_CULPI